jgi:hypothetical protein
MSFSGGRPLSSSGSRGFSSSSLEVVELGEPDLEPDFWGVPCKDVDGQLLGLVGDEERGRMVRGLLLAMNIRPAMGDQGPPAVPRGIAARKKAAGLAPRRRLRMAR